MSVIVGLTGQSGGGKTTISQIFRENGFEIINCDIVARKATEDASECNKQLAEIFPNCFDADYRLDRKKLAEIVFSDSDKLKILNSIIYPHINRLIAEQIAQMEKSEFILLDAPTLFEAGVDKSCDCVVSVIADREIRTRRIISRDKISRELAQKRFDSQNSEEFFRERSDYIIENNGDISDTHIQTENIIKNIKGKFNGKKKKFKA